jgi:predicted Zn-dependent peptidase
VESVNAEAEGKKDPGLFIIRLNLLSPHDADSALAIISSELRAMRGEGLSQAELEAAKSSLKAEYVYGLDRPAHMVSRLGYFQLVGGDYNMIFDFYERLSKVSNQDIREAASRHLNSDNRSIVELLPKTKDGGER